MDSTELLQGARRQAVLESMIAADATEALADFRRHLESGTGSLNEWDDRFLAFIRSHGDGLLLRGSAEGAIHFIFSPQARAGFWVVTRANLRGKGFFSESDIERLTALALEKGLLHT